MKTVKMLSDYVFRVNGQAFVQYVAGREYQRVPELQARAIVAAKAGKIIVKDESSE